MLSTYRCAVNLRIKTFQTSRTYARARRAMAGSVDSVSGRLGQAIHSVQGQIIVEIQEGTIKHLRRACSDCRLISIRVRTDEYRRPPNISGVRHRRKNLTLPGPLTLEPISLYPP